MLNDKKIKSDREPLGTFAVPCYRVHFHAFSVHFHPLCCRCVVCPEPCMASRLVFIRCIGGAAFWLCTESTRDADADRRLLCRHAHGAYRHTPVRRSADISPVQTDRTSASEKKIRRIDCTLRAGRSEELFMHVQNATCGVTRTAPAAHNRVTCPRGSSGGIDFVECARV